MTARCGRAPVSCSFRFLRGGGSKGSDENQILPREKTYDAIRPLLSPSTLTIDDGPSPGVNAKVIDPALEVRDIVFLRREPRGQLLLPDRPQQVPQRLEREPERDGGGHGYLLAQGQHVGADGGHVLLHALARHLDDLL